MVARGARGSNAELTAVIDYLSENHVLTPSTVRGGSGPDDRPIVDPGDASDTAIDSIRSAVERRRGEVTAIVLTATDPDHAAAAEALAIPLDVPVMVALGGGRHLPYDVVELGDDDRLPIDVDIRVRLAPGPTLRLDPVRSARK